MNIREVKIDLFNNFGNTGQLEIEYHNKPKIVCYIERMHDSNEIDEIDFTVKLMTVETGDNPYRNIDFENMKSIRVKYNGSTNFKVFE